VILSKIETVGFSFSSLIKDEDEEEDDLFEFSLLFFELLLLDNFLVGLSSFLVKSLV
jgi:hypothetical protein